MAEENDWQGRLRELAALVCDLCLINGIPCALSGETALSAYRGGELNDFPEICIFAADARRFAQAVESAGVGHLALDSMLHNDAYPTFDMRVYDTRTLDFDLPTVSTYRMQCLHVTVRLVVRTSHPKRTAERLEGLGAAHRRLANYRKRSGGVAVPAAFVGRRAFNHAMRCDTPRAQGALLEGSAVAADCLAGCDSQGIDGHDFPLPHDCEAFLKALFGKRWNKHKAETYEETDAAFREADYSWDEYRGRLGNLDLPTYERARRAYRSTIDEFKLHDDVIQRCYKLLSRTHQRFVLWQRYAPMKARLQARYDAGDYGALGEDLKAYLAKLRSFKQYDLGLCFDPDIFEITMGYLRATGREADAAKYEALVPEQHKKPIQLPQPAGGSR